jgi:hypothetical protein
MPKTPTTEGLNVPPMASRVDLSRQQQKGTRPTVRRIGGKSTNGRWWCAASTMVDNSIAFACKHHPPVVEAGANVLTARPSCMVERSGKSNSQNEPIRWTGENPTPANASVGGPWAEGGGRA